MTGGALEKDKEVESDTEKDLGDKLNPEFTDKSTKMPGTDFSQSTDLKSSAINTEELMTEEDISKDLLK